MRPRLFNAPHGGVTGFSAVALYAAFEMGRQWGIWWPLLVGGPLLVALVVDTMVRDRRDRRRQRKALVRWRSWTKGEG